MKLSVYISNETLEMSADITLGYITGDVTVSSSNQNQLNEMKLEMGNQCYQIEKIAELPRIRETRAFYRSLGKDPSRYRVSSEALQATLGGQ